MRRSQATTPVLVHHQASGEKASTPTWMSVSAPVTWIFIQEVISLRASCWSAGACARHTQNIAFSFACLQENKLIKRHSWLALALPEHRCGREGNDKRCGVSKQQRVGRGLRSHVRWQHGATVLIQLASPGFPGLDRLRLDYLQARPKKKEDEKKKRRKSTVKTPREILLLRPFNWMCSIIY